MAWTPQEKQIVQDLGNRLNVLEAKVKILEDCCNNNAGCTCDCKIYPHVVTIESDYFYIDENGNEVAKTAEELGIPHDRFPEPACVSEKGIITMWDVWILCAYHEQDGWIIIDINRK